jgi:hypothetical protein
MMETAKSRTLQADVELDEDGNPIRPGGKPSPAGKLGGDDNVVIVETAETATMDSGGQTTSTHPDQPKLFESNAA